MAQKSFIAQSYDYYFWSSRKTGKANINIKGGSGQSCTLWFIEDPDAELSPAAEIAPNHFSFYYHFHQLAEIIDLLRNEKPVTVYFNDDNGFNNSRISTGNEPIGEGEIT